MSSICSFLFVEIVSKKKEKKSVNYVATLF